MGWILVRPLVPVVSGHSVGRLILRLRPHRRLKVEVRIKIKIKVIQSRIKRYNLISLSLKASLHKFSRGSLVIRIACLSL